MNQSRMTLGGDCFPNVAHVSPPLKKDCLRQVRGDSEPPMQQPAWLTLQRRSQGRFPNTKALTTWS
eukprot:5410828-Amphidinium_carterae.1